MSKDEKLISFRVDADLHQQIKRLCVDDQKTIKDYITELVKADLEKRGIK